MIFFILATNSKAILFYTYHRKTKINTHTRTQKQSKKYHENIPVIESTMNDSNSYLLMDDENWYVEINVRKSRNCTANRVKLL